VTGAGCVIILSNDFAGSSGKSHFSLGQASRIRRLRRLHRLLKMIGRISLRKPQQTEQCLVCNGYCLNLCNLRNRWILLLRIPAG